MSVRLAVAFSVVLIGFAFPVGQAAAQYYPAYPQRPISRPLPPDYLELDDEPEPALPYRRGAQLPPDDRLGPPAVIYPDTDTASAPPPGFVYPEQGGLAPAPYGHIPGSEIERSDIPPASADPSSPRPPAEVGSVAPGPGPGQQPSIMTMLPPEDQPETVTKELPPQFRRQLVDYRTKEPAGTIVIDTSHTYLYLVLGNGKAVRYGIGVGRDGFTWAGTERVSRMAEWPDWHPPEEMIERQPYLPRFMAGGESNPLGARALYLGKTLYRIHGTNQPSTIGSFVSSGCVRLVNEDIEDLYRRVQVGTRVVVLPGSKPPTTAQAQ
jgi:lipoprotein-anchoring transpeptidase ErfK/SrfK